MIGIKFYFRNYYQRKRSYTRELECIGMHSLNLNALATKLEFSKDAFFVYLKDGRILIVPLAYFPKLLNEFC